MKKNKEFYTKIPIPKKEFIKSGIDSSNWWYYVLGNILIVLIGPFIIPGKTIYSGQLVRMWILSLAIVLLLNIIFLWFLLVRPYLEKGKGYYLLGKFEVLEKETSLGFKYLKLNPGNAHKIKVNDNFFRSVQKGDKILLERNCLGEIKAIKKVSGIRERIER